MTPAIVQLQNKEEAKFICSSCGADRGCQCNAPAIEKLAEKMEQARQRSKRAYAKKTQQNQQPSNVRNGNDSDDAEASAEKRKAVFAVYDPKPAADEYMSEAKKALLDRAEIVAEAAKYDGPVDDEVRAAVRAVIEKWTALLGKLNRG